MAISSEERREIRASFLGLSRCSRPFCPTDQGRAHLKAYDQCPDDIPFQKLHLLPGGFRSHSKLGDKLQISCWYVYYPPSTSVDTCLGGNVTNLWKEPDIVDEEYFKDEIAAGIDVHNDEYREAWPDGFFYPCCGMNLTEEMCQVGWHKAADPDDRPRKRTRSE